MCELKLIVEVAVVLYPYSPQEIAVKILIHFSIHHQNSMCGVLFTSGPGKAFE